MNKQSKKYNLKGFTLIELIAVIAIIAIISTILIPSILKYVERANNKADVANASTICKAIQLECADDPDQIEYFTKNPWGSGTNTDGTAYEADDHGYVYVDKNEVRVSSYTLAKLLEAHGYITSAGPKRNEIDEYTYSEDQCNGLICMSSRTWYRYQVNIACRNGEILFTYSANSKDGESANTSTQSRNDNLHDQSASEKFAKMIGGIADNVVSLPPVN